MKTWLVVLEVTDDCDPEPLTSEELIDAIKQGVSGINYEVKFIAEEVKSLDAKH